MFARGDRRHIPDHGALGIEIGRYDKQKAALALLDRDGVEQCVVGIVLDQLLQRFGLEHASPDDTVDAIDPQQASDLPAGKDVLQHRIVTGS